MRFLAEFTEGGMDEADTANGSDVPTAKVRLAALLPVKNCRLFTFLSFYSKMSRWCLTKQGKQRNARVTPGLALFATQNAPN